MGMPEEPLFPLYLSDPVRWGILGLGSIARGAILPAMLATPGAQPVAVASMDPSRAATFAADFGVPKVHATYQDVLDDADVEAVYIALPNHLHAEWAIRAARAGKHVLCEKPLAHTFASAVEMRRAADASEVLLMEAVMYRFHPRMRRIAELISSGLLGTIKLLRASFCFTLTQYDNYRNDPAMGGGALLDVGSYCINAARWLIGEEPLAAIAMGTLLESGADESISGVLGFPSGALAQIECSFGTAEYQRLNIVGTDGMIDVVAPFTAWRNDEVSFLFRHAGQDEEVLFPPTDPYALMIAHFDDVVRGEDILWWPTQDGVETMRAIDALRRAANSGHTERVRQ